MHDLEIVYLPPGDLTPYENNARKHAPHDVDAIIASIEKFGFSDPIGIWSDKNIIVEGHGRQIAALQMGLSEVPCIRLDHMTDEQRRAYALAHNKTAELSEWDFGKLEEELAHLQIDGIDMTKFDFDLSGIGGADSEPIQEDNYDVKLPDEPKSKRGQIYILGNHRLMCGDSTDINDVDKLLDGQKADLYLTDPPYNVDYEGGTSEKLKIANDKMKDADFRSFLCSAFTAAKHAIKAGAAFYIWHAESEGFNFRAACKDAGFTIRQCLIWEKNALVLGRQDYQWKHEPCLYGWNDGGSHAWYSDRKQTTILNFEKPMRNGEHPTMKPVALFDYLIQNSSKRDDIVFDGFAGSGTTIVACEQNGRKAYAMELDPHYVDVIIDRWESLTGEKAVLVE